MYSLFEEQIMHESNALDYFLSRGTESYPEALTYFPEMESYNIGPESYLDLISKLKEIGQYTDYWKLKRNLFRWLD